MSHNCNQTLTGVPNITVIHSLPGRVRLNVPGLKGSSSMADTLAAGIKLIDHVRRIKANPLTGSLLVEYDVRRLSEKKLLEKIVPVYSRPAAAVNHQTTSPTAMVKSGRMGIYCGDSRTLEILSKVDTIIFDGRGALPEESREVGDVPPGKLPPMMAKVYNNFISMAVGVNSFRLLSSKGHRNVKTLREVEREIAAALDSAAAAPLATGQCGMDTVLKGNWHSMTLDGVLSRLKSDLTRGLDKEQVQYRLKVFGRNKINEERPVGLLARMRGQFKDFLVKALMVSALVCAVLGEFTDALAIVAILVVNALLGALQEHKAEGALQALSEITAPTARVRRAGKVDRVPAEQLVPGDIVLLEQGDGVPADLRIIEASCLELEESALTGEPYPVAKSAGHIADCIPLLNCSNLVFMGTNVTRGRGAGIVTATGMNTEVGKIAAMIHRQESPPTPLQRRMAEAGGVILKYCLAVSAMVVLAGLLRGGSPFGMFLTGVSLAVAAIPEGLPAVVTIALASGVRRMAKENAVVKNLPAVETLGNVTLICTDKTGTLTRNRQILQRVYTGSGFWQAGAGGDNTLKPHSGGCRPEDLESLVTAGILCNHAELRRCDGKGPKSAGQKWRVEGDPTEGALLLAALGNKTNYKEVREKWTHIKEIPFDAGRLMMTVICRHPDHGCAAFVKGAPEVVLELCSHILVKGEKEPLDKLKRRQILNINGEMTREAMRVLAIAHRSLDNPDAGDPEDSLTLLGLVGMVDPVRPEVARAVDVSRRAGIHVAMITGDHPYTALAVAKKVGISSGDKVLTGQDIDRLNDLELAEALREVRVFARVLPGQKLRLVKTFRQQGEVVAMIGDGINDAPAVREADIGVAMGESGTDVTKQAADIIITDDNFATLLPAVEQGRGIYNNIRRSVRYLLSTNVGLVFLVFTAVLLGLPVPLIPLQLLFLNVLGDGLPALALGVEPPARDLMDRPPRPVEEKFFAHSLGSQIISRGLATGLVGLEAYHRLLKQGDLARARTVAMATFAAGKLLFALECGEKKDGNNRYLAGSVALSAALLGGAIYLPYGRRILKTVPLGMKDVAGVLGASGLTFILERVIASFLQGVKPEDPAEKQELPL
ncbi:zinc and mercury transporting ATPase [Desulfocucumis palustris]|uniref:Zinc and mercury transporting ATPase n=1 Tax=Desulfocucumis palustris TaxID=1898651 RepID=A0A2L2XEP1_9FIRM|nr:HAD-IC family P-type ATPase [Desulfocucumis palustris]GBF34602.1 zinc and mercury transporting ATPase [Desulfocucumis palustris]